MFTILFLSTLTASVLSRFQNAPSPVERPYGPFYTYPDYNISNETSDEYGSKALEDNIGPLFLDKVSDYLNETIGTPEELVEHLRNTSYIKSEEVANVLLKIDQRNYLDLASTKRKFPMDLGYGAFFTYPQYHAYVLEVIKDNMRKPDIKVLDIGSGSGFFTACLAVMLQGKGVVVGIEHIPELVKFATDNINKEHPQLITSGKVKFLVGDGRLGAPQESPFDLIHVGGSMTTIPEVLVNQLKVGGRMIVPIGPEEDDQIFTLIDKEVNGIKITNLTDDAHYAPLMDKEKQLQLHKEKWNQ